MKSPNPLVAPWLTTRTLRRPAMLAKTGLSRTTAYNLERAGDFPAHFMLTPRCAVWYEHQIDAWLEGRRQTALPSATCPARGRSRDTGAAT
jgi:prophage regulatory protein